MGYAVTPTGDDRHLAKLLGPEIALCCGQFTLELYLRAAFLARHVDERLQHADAAAEAEKARLVAELRAAQTGLDQSRVEIEQDRQLIGTLQVARAGCNWRPQAVFPAAAIKWRHC